MTAAGDVSDYDAAARASLVSNMASTLGVPETDISLTVTAASVNLVFEVAVADETELEAVEQHADSSLGTAADATTALGVSVQSAPVTATVTASPSTPPPATPPHAPPSPAPTPPTSIDSTQSNIATGGDDVVLVVVPAVVVTLMVCVLVALLAWRRARSQGRAQRARLELAPATAPARIRRPSRTGIRILAPSAAPASSKAAAPTAAPAAAAAAAAAAHAVVSAELQTPTSVEQVEIDIKVDSYEARKAEVDEAVAMATAKAANAKAEAAKAEAAVRAALEAAQAAEAAAAAKKVAAIEVERIEAEAKADAEARARAEAEAQADAEAKAKAEVEAKVEAKAKAEEEQQALFEAEVQAQAEGWAMVEAWAQAKAESETKHETKFPGSPETPPRTPSAPPSPSRADAELQKELEAGRLEAEAIVKERPLPLSLSDHLNNNSGNIRETRLRALVEHLAENEPHSTAAAISIQRLARGQIGRRSANEAVHQLWVRYFLREGKLSLARKMGWVPEDEKQAAVVMQRRWRKLRESRWQQASAAAEESQASQLWSLIFGPARPATSRY